MDRLIDIQRAILLPVLPLDNVLEEGNNENLRVIYVLRESMTQTIHSQDIDRSRRLPGKEPHGKSRPVIVKLTRITSAS